MISIALFLSTVLLVQGSPAPGVFDSNDDARIIGGQKAGEGEFPYQVSIQYRRQHFCGGSIINPLTILTAGHCVHELPGIVTTSMMVRCGSNKYNSGGTLYKVKKIIKHEKYDPKTYKYDIALLLTSVEIKLSDTAKMITLSDANIGAGEPLTLSGWGLSRFPNPISPEYLQTANMTSTSVDVCKKALKDSGPPADNIGDDQLCAQGKTGTGACMGDSGGPLVNKDGEQVGVVSFGIPCARERYPDVYTRVSSFLPWIKDNMKSE